MNTGEGKVKAKRGTWKRLAKRYKVSQAHISLVASGQRPGRPAIMRAIEKVQKQLNAPAAA